MILIIIIIIIIKIVAVVVVVVIVSQGQHRASSAPQSYKPCTTKFLLGWVTKYDYPFPFQGDISDCLFGHLP